MKKRGVVVLSVCLAGLGYSDSALAGGGVESDSGSIKLPEMTLALSGSRELQIREPSMCEGGGDVKFKWNKNSNKMSLNAKFDGLPYREDICYEYDAGSEYNDYPECVEGDDGEGNIGVWQMWFVGHFFSRTSTFYYDFDSGDLLYNEYDIPDEGLDPGAIPIEIPVVQMVCSDFFESNPSNLKSKITITSDYDQILDVTGSGGVFVGVLPVNLFAPDLDIYYTDYLEGGALPVSEAMHMDDIRANIAAAEATEELCEACEASCSDQACLDACAVTPECTALPGFVIATSYEPLPKPDYLRARDNLMIGFGAGYPERFTPAGVTPDDVGECETFQYPDPY